MGIGSSKYNFDKPVVNSRTFYTILLLQQLPISSSEIDHLIQGENLEYPNFIKRLNRQGWCKDFQIIISIKTDNGEITAEAHWE
jgi:hypothetical protein